MATVLSIANIPTLPVTADTFMIAGWVGYSSGQSNHLEFPLLVDQGAGGLSITLHTYSNRTEWFFSGRDSAGHQIFSGHSIVPLANLNENWMSFAISASVSTHTLQFMANLNLYSTQLLWSLFTPVAYHPTTDPWTIGPASYPDDVPVDIPLPSIALADFRFGAGEPFFDLSDHSNVRLLFTIDNNPRFWGANGEDPTGHAPAVYLHGDETSYAFNWGTGGSWHEGPLTPLDTLESGLGPGCKEAPPPPEPLPDVIPMEEWRLPGKKVFTGTAFVSGFGIDTIYVISADGQIYSIPTSPEEFPIGPVDINLGDLITVGAPFPQTPPSPTWSLVTSGATLFTISSMSPSGVSRFTLTAHTSGVSGGLVVPMTHPMCLAASEPASALAVGGWSGARINSGFNKIVVDPIAPLFIGIGQSTNLLNVYSGLHDIWTFKSATSGSGAPKFGDWSPTGSWVMVSDPVNGIVSIYRYLFGVLDLKQSIRILGASAVKIVIGIRWAFVCQPARNTVTILALQGLEWEVSQTLSVNGACSVVTITSESVAIGGSDGVHFYTLTNRWVPTGFTALPFTVTHLDLDTLGHVISAGSVGGSGYFAGFVKQEAVTTIGWSGGVAGMVCQQEQILVADSVSSYIRIFDYVDHRNYSHVSFELPANFGMTDLAVSQAAHQYAHGGTIFAAGSGMTQEYVYKSPYRLGRVPSGKISILQGATWHNIDIGDGHMPQTMIFDPSGNLWFTTMQNEYYSVPTVGQGAYTVSFSGIIPQINGQPQNVPLGISSLQWRDNHIYGVTSLAGDLMRIV